jgi:MFS family permease
MPASRGYDSPLTTLKLMLTKAYRRYVLGTLTLVFTLNYLDRGLMILLLNPIKQDLRLSDTQLGFLTGIAFALFYATLGIPIARWADRGNRVTITAVAIGLWGATVMLCPLVGTFTQLVLARIAAAVGESGCMPPTYSLLGDYFPAPAERTRAMAVYWLANPLAALVSFTAGGRLNELYGWRMAFFVMGIPALLVAAVVKLTIVEPRLCLGVAPNPERQMPRMAHVLRSLWHERSLRHLTIALTLVFTLGSGLGPWFAAFMMRSHGMGTADLGVWLGFIFGLGGIAGILLGGYSAGRWVASSERGQMRLSSIMIASLAPCLVLFLFLPRKHQALIALMPLIVVFNFVLGPTFALMQRLVLDDMRATTLAVAMLLANLIGMGIGPQIVGILSDLLMPTLANDSLRYAMLIMCFVALWAAYHFWRVGQTVNEDLLAVARLAKS